MPELVCRNCLGTGVELGVYGRHSCNFCNTQTQQSAQEEIRTRHAKGLIIRKDWLDKIFNHGKCWEMRSSHTKYRGMINLIEAGSGRIVGECMLMDSLEISEDSAKANIHNHHVADLELLKKWRYAWVLNHVRKYENSMPYVHPKGAVIWVKF